MTKRGKGMEKAFRHAWLALLVALSATGPATAAGFFNNGKDWLAASVEVRAGYIQGINDSANFVFVDDSLDTAVVKVARTQCLIQKKMTVAMLADMITNGYTREESRYGRLPPLVVYMTKLGDVCRETINRKRAEFGLPPQ